MVTAVRYIKHQGIGMAFHGVASFAVFILSFVSYFSGRSFVRKSLDLNHVAFASARSLITMELSLFCMN
jgi:hypothetical protein